MAAPRYVADPEDCCRTVELDGLTALYHRPSGQTHILAEPAPQLLAALGGNPLALEELTAAIAERFDLEQGDALQARLEELEAAGLVSRT